MRTAARAVEGPGRTKSKNWREEGAAGGRWSLTWHLQGTPGAGGRSRAVCVCASCPSPSHGGLRAHLPESV